jgi:hypothetical protein
MPIVGITHSSRKVNPGTPTIGTATDVGTGRAYNDGAITVTFTPADLNATSFTASAYDNLAAVTRTATGSASPITITGFRSTAVTTATVTASNTNGTSAASSASNSVTVTTVPQAPATIGTLSLNGSGSLSLNTWGSVTNSSPTNGGKTISGYRARLFPGSLSSATGDLGSPGATVWNSLTSGNSYTANGYAVNANGESAASPSSNSATVGLAPTLSTNPSFTASSQTVTLTSGTWANTPTSYTYQIATSAANLSAGTYVLNTNTTNSSVSYNGGYSTTYYGRVTAANAYGSATSGNFTATTGAFLGPTLITAPVLTRDPNLDKLTVTAGTWNGNPTSYAYVLYKTDNTYVGNTAYIPETSFVFQDTQGYNIEYSTSYYVNVTALNAYDGTGAASNSVTTVAYVPPPIVTPEGSISASNVTTTQATATFTVTNAASWDVRSSYTGGAFYLSGLNPSSPLTVTSVPAGGTGVALVLNMWTGANRTGTLYQVSTTYNVPSAATAPTTPTVSNSYSIVNEQPVWTASWSSSGSGTITYYWNFYQSQTYGGTITATASGSTTSATQPVAGNSTYGLWGYFTVYAQNSVGPSATAQSNWA